MINYYDKNRFVSKGELARLAGVSRRTFSRYLQSRQHILTALGVNPKSKLLPPQAVKYLCEDYCIDLPPQLQDRQVLNSSPLYKQLVRELQMHTQINGKWTRITEIPPDI
jgi:hypothetical protein